MRLDEYTCFVHIEFAHFVGDDIVGVAQRRIAFLQQVAIGFGSNEACDAAFLGIHVFLVEINDLQDLLLLRQCGVCDELAEACPVFGSRIHGKQLFGEVIVMAYIIE